MKLNMYRMISVLAVALLFSGCESLPGMGDAEPEPAPATVVEGAAYTELDWSDNEETADFLKKGGYIGLTLEMMDRDDVGAVRRIPREIGNAAWRTLSGLVSALFTDNSGVGPTMGDSVALFDAAGHTNLLTTALSAAQWDVVIQAI